MGILPWSLPSKAAKFSLYVLRKQKASVLICICYFRFKSSLDALTKYN